MSTPSTDMPPQDTPAPLAGNAPPHVAGEPGHGRHKRVRTLRFVAVFTVVVLGLARALRGKHCAPVLPGDHWCGGGHPA